MCFTKFGEATLASCESALNARKKEAAADKEGTGVEGTLFPGEAYSASRDWINDEFQLANAELKGETWRMRTRRVKESGAFRTKKTC